MSRGVTLSSGLNVQPHPVDEVGIKERVARLATRSIKKSSKVEGLKLALSMVDLTTLEGADTPGRVRQLCTKAIHLHSGRYDLPMVAAVCVYPTMVRVAREALKGTPIKVAAVATAFPSGMNPLNVKLEDTRYAVGEGAHEIDMVISRGDFLRGEYSRVADEIAEVKMACGEAHLKVILETGELGTLDRVRLASDIAMEAGADFIKTSTGKIQPAATPEVVLVMLQAIADFYRKTGKRIGMKPAGGIANAKAALNLLVMVREVLGPAWLNPDLFRIGASKLPNDILMQLEKERTGIYQGGDYFSND
jgi:deoxyribose-phosphate aldolase